MKTLLYLIYGDQRAYHLELTHSVLSAARFLADDPADVQIVLASDAENQRPDLPVQPMIISPDTLRDWQLGGAYNHAAKVFALHHALDHFNHPVALIDSDTIVRDHPRQLFGRIGPGRALLHTSEGPLLQSKEWPHFERLITVSGGAVAGWPISAQTVMHNSGVFGLHPEDAPLMADIKAVMRAIRETSDVFTSEQLAASIVLDAKTQISDCADIVDHYWDGPRDYYHYQMAGLYPDVLAGGGVVAGRTGIEPLRNIPESSLINRVIARIKQARRRNDPEYGFAYLAYLNALSNKASNPQLANIWAGTAVEMLLHGVKRQHPQVSTDFAAFGPDTLAQQSWMSDKLQGRWRTYWAG